MRTTGGNLKVYPSKPSTMNLMSAARSTGWLSFCDRHFNALAGVLLVVMMALQFAVMVGDSQANDESFHLLTGYEFLKTGSVPLNREHPPLAQLIAASPLLLLNLRQPGPHRDAGESREVAREHEFLYENVYPVETILLWARSAALLWLVLLGGLTAWWTRRHFGPLAALAAGALLAFDPAFLSHGHYTDNDVPVALCFLAAVVSWNGFLARGRMSGAAACGILTGAAMATKYSALLLFPIFVLLYGLSWWQQAGNPVSEQRFRHSFGHLAKSLAIVVATMTLVMFAVFRFEVRPLVPMEMMENPEPVSAKVLKRPDLLGGLAPMILNHSERLRLLDILFQQTPIPAPAFLRGLFLVTRHGGTGHPTYLLGQYSVKGWWYFFPVVLAVKTPVSTVLLFLLALVLATLALLRDGWRGAIGRLRRCNRDWYALTVPPLFYFLISVQSHINIGIRHLLPISAFVFIWMAAVLFSPSTTRSRLWAPRVAVACLALGVAETALAFPTYLGFFNFPSGGPRAGVRYVVDSNLDWGQDLKRLKTYQSSHDLKNACVAYFGIGRPDDYGVIWRPVPGSLAEAQRSGCVVVMSNTQFAFDGGDEKAYQWLRGLVPVDYVGSSFRVYRIPPLAPVDRATLR